MSFLISFPNFQKSKFELVFLILDLFLRKPHHSHLLNYSFFPRNSPNNKFWLETYSKPSQTSQKEHFPKLVNGFKGVNYFRKTVHIDIWQSSEYASANLPPLLPFHSLEGNGRNKVFYFIYLQNLKLSSFTSQISCPEYLIF